jgi:hypothetical protein
MTLSVIAKAFARDEIAKLQAEIIQAERNTSDQYRQMADNALEKLENAPIRKSLSSDSRFNMFSPDEQIIMQSAFKALVSQQGGGLQPVQITDTPPDAQSALSDDEAVETAKSVIFGIAESCFRDQPVKLETFKRLIENEFSKVPRGN